MQLSLGSPLQVTIALARNHRDLLWAIGQTFQLSAGLWGDLLENKEVCIGTRIWLQVSGQATAIWTSCLAFYYYVRVFRPLQHKSVTEVALPDPRSPGPSERSACRCGLSSSVSHSASLWPAPSSSCTSASSISTQRLASARSRFLPLLLTPGPLSHLLLVWPRDRLLPLQLLRVCAACCGSEEGKGEMGHRCSRLPGLPTCLTLRLPSFPSTSASRST